LTFGSRDPNVKGQNRPKYHPLLKEWNTTLFIVDYTLFLSSERSLFCAPLALGLYWSVKAEKAGDKIKLLIIPKVYILST